ncbi:unnamed protein product [Clonostachys rosea f. rosea IK726]|uniref:Peptidase S9 prolyl oligopeptidase catalytic domain-containing protein n=2 Tax=Bionectria ochroleuca TaxID=29856 RepID=A0A0B7JY18_BIOOC|nr:unnamed protein product [Clonostachys rosea f. rosea IK726]
MARRKITRYGDWESPITQDLVIAKARKFTSPRISRATGRVFFAESREDGTMTISEVLPDDVKDRLPAQFSVSNKVYEYGGSAFDALPSGRVIFSNSDNSVQILDPDTRTVTEVVNNPALRYSNFSANSKTPWVAAIEEDHIIDEPAQVQNRLVAINSDTGAVTKIVEGADFYYPPELNHDGSKIAWLEWNRPDVPWCSAKLYWGLLKDGSVSNVQLVTGGLLAGVAEPRWGPDDTLYFGMEKTNYRQLFKLRPGDKEAEQITPPELSNAEFAELVLMPGSRTYAPLSASTVVATATINGVSRLVLIEDTATGKFRFLAGEGEVNQIMLDSLTGLGEDSFIGIFSGSVKNTYLKIFNIQNPAADRVVRKSTDHELPDAWIAKPQELRVPSKGSPSRTIYGFLWMPRNPDHTAPEGTLPPLIIKTHGGPTGRFGPGLQLRCQYFTSRGYAVVCLNYHGSIGYGRAYRDALWGTWGILDTDDAAEVAEHLVSAGRVREDAVGCTGISAGGYNTLMCVTRHPKLWAGAVDVSGICDLESFYNRTHKLELDYTEALVIDKVGASDEEKLAVYRERSAIYHTSKIETPLLILHAEQDTVIPMNQATDIEKALKEQGKEVRLVRVPNDGHTLAKPPSARIWLDEEEKWWRKTLL